ncbi:MAG: ABC transporter permease [Verrucomicrobiota bacterium]
MSNESLPITEIQAGRKARIQQFFWDLWMYRDLFMAFLTRDIKVRYKQTILGITWVVIQPLATAGAFSMIFGGIAQMPVGSMPYPVFYLAALVVWSNFANSLSGSAASMESSAGLISKVYFPRVVVPGAMIVSTLPDFLIGFVLLNVVAAIYGLWTPMLLLCLPLLLVSLAAACGIGLTLAALNAQYRDVRYIVPFLIQMGMLVTPVIYPLDKVPHWGQLILYGNPVAGVITCFRWALGGPAPPPDLITANVCAAIVYLLIGLLFFRWREGKLVDVL